MIKSGVRNDKIFNIFHQLRKKWITRGIRNIGHETFVDRNVRFLRHTNNIKIGNRVMIKEGARICSAQRDAKIIVGDWTTIGYHTFIFASTGILIGNNCLIAPFCYLVDSNHGILKNQLIQEQLMTAAPIVIGDDVWLGTRVTILMGVTIGKGAVIGAGSVVRENIPEYAIATGNPAKIRGNRK